MADIAQLESALVKADAAGAVDDARALASEIRRLRASKIKPEPEPVYDPTEGMSEFEKGAAGLGKAIVDTGRGLGQLVGAVSSDDVKEARKRDRALMDTGAGLTGNIIGNVGMALAPGGALKGASVAARAVPAMARYAAPLSVAGGALMAPRTIPSALAVGGTLGAIQPAGDITERITSALVGAGATAAVPVAMRGIRAGKAAIEPFYESGQQQIIGRALNSAAGGQADDAARNLAMAGTPFVGPQQPGVQRQMMGELVPGSIPTAGQASGNAGIAALERAAVAAVPESTVAHEGRRVAQNVARVNALDDMAGTGGQRAFYAAERDATAEQLYEQAYQKGIDIYRDAATGRMLPKAVVSGIRGEITKLTSRPAIQDAMLKARELAANEGVNMKDFTGSVKGLDYVKRALDDKIAAATGNEARILTALKNRLLTTIDRLSPDYAAARKVFQEMSRPINQMDIAEEIAKKSITPDTRQMQSRAFARALSDDTAQRATGFNRATLEGTMEPRQMQGLEAIRDDLVRATTAQNAGRGAGSDTVQKLAYSNILDQAGVPSFLRDLAPAQVMGNLAGRGADALYGGANRQIAQRLAMALLDPGEAAQMMQSATPSHRARLAEALASRILTPIGMSSPFMLNAQQ